MIHKTISVDRKIPVMVKYKDSDLSRLVETNTVTEVVTLHEGTTELVNHFKDLLDESVFETIEEGIEGNSFIGKFLNKVLIESGSKIIKLQDQLEKKNKEIARLQLEIAIMKENTFMKKLWRFLRTWRLR